MSVPRPLLDLGPCGSCGYDLRGQRPGGRCPECGAAIPRSRPEEPRPGEVAADLALALGWIGKAALLPLPFGLGCLGALGCFGGPLLVATTGCSWLRLIGVGKARATLATSHALPSPLPLLRVECGAAALAAGAIFAASNGFLPGFVAGVAVALWLGMAAAGTLAAMLFTDGIARAVGATPPPAFLRPLVPGVLAVGMIGLATSFLVRSLPGPMPVAVANAAAVCGLLGGLAASAAGVVLWRTTAALAEELPRLPRFSARPRAPTPRPEPPPRELAPEPEPIELEPPRETERTAEEEENDGLRDGGKR